MSFDYYYRGVKVTKKSLEATVGVQRVARVIAEAKEIIRQDPNIGLDWADGISLRVK